MVYDRRANGGTTTIEADKDGNRVREYVSLGGTHNNCAGGRTPWETRLTCEETEAVLGKKHGYVFEVDPYDQEAMAAYTSQGALVSDLSVASRPGTTYRVGWVEVPDRDAALVSTRKQFAPGEVTRSRKLEGMWWDDGGAYFVASFARTSDGSAAPHDGQVWFLDPLAGTIELRLRFAYTPADQAGDPDGPDNITVSPYGGVIIAEDGEGRNHLVGSTESGETFFFARNELEGDSEFTGPNFSRNKQTLFANIQSPGYVFAIRGPFTKQR